MWYVENNWLKCEDGNRSCNYIKTAAKFTKSLIWLLGRHGLVNYYWNGAELVLVLDGFIIKHGMSEAMYDILAVMLADYMVGK